MHIGQLSKRLYGSYSYGNNGLMLHQDEFLRPTNHELFPAGSGNVEIATFHFFVIMAIIRSSNSGVKFRKTPKHGQGRKPRTITNLRFLREKRVVSCCKTGVFGHNTAN